MSGAGAERDLGRWRRARAGLRRHRPLDLTWKLIVFLGLGILATEFAWAERLLDFGRRTLRSWLRWLGRQHLAVRVLVSLATLAFVAGVVGLTLHLSVGLPFVTS